MGGVIKRSAFTYNDQRKEVIDRRKLLACSVLETS